MDWGEGGKVFLKVEKKRRAKKKRAGKSFFFRYIIYKLKYYLIP